MFQKALTFSTILASCLLIACAHHGKKGHGCSDCKSKHMKHMHMSAEKHEKMAEMHTAVAECLNSGKDKSECKELMKKPCDKEGCKMKGKHKSAATETKSDEKKN